MKVEHEPHFVPSTINRIERKRSALIKDVVKIGVEQMTKIILDVGSGHYPHPQATILSDITIGESEHRRWIKPGIDSISGIKAVVDHRPFIVCSVEALPFKDKVIDVVHCSHVIEHIDDPNLARNELCRVGKHGIICYPAPSREKYLAEDWEAHKWIIDPDGVKHTDTSHFNPLAKILRFLWARNCRIQLRSKLNFILRRFSETREVW